MPTTYTHYAYGQDVFIKLPEQIQKVYRTLWIIII